MYNFLRNKKILVTGGTGSIGSEIVRQILKYSPTVVRVLDLDETKELELSMELKEYGYKARFLIGDVRDASRLRWAVEDIDIIFHAAALKHVPFCEFNPFEAVKTNVLGAQNIIEAALNENVERFIDISTDKAAAPSNTMGATKLLGERLTTAANFYKGTRRTVLAAVRFGNVLGSRGSLLPVIKKQIAKGGPVTITDVEMTRYFMSISQAVSLVLKAAEIAEGGEVFILKMPLFKIKDLLSVLIEEWAGEFGHKPSDIALDETGVRAGEKIVEALMTEEEAKYALELEDMFVIKSLKEGVFMKPSQPVKRAQEERRLTKEEIREFLKDELKKV